MSKFDYFDEIMPYKKKSTATPPKKAKHKHLAEPCILEHPADWWQKEHLRTGETRFVIDYYCPVCGKVMGLHEKDRWYTTDKVPNISWIACQNTETEEYKRELDPKTRTLPTFMVDSVFDKFVTLPDGKDNLDE